LKYDSLATSYSNISYENNLNSFNGFIGIQKLNPGSPSTTATKEDIFSFGNLLGCFRAKFHCFFSGQTSLRFHSKRG
jgi:hypothetical protein